MKNKIRIGVLGCANIARRSMIPAILELPEYFELIGVSSRNFEKAAKFSAEFGCMGYEGYESMVQDPKIDALYIPLPTGLHKEWINKALAVGKHVYSEKSIASCYADAEAMVVEARKANVVLMEGFMFQYHSQHLKVKELLASGVIGELRNFYSAFSFPPLPSGDFRYDDEIGGGVLLDAAGYPLRATHFLLGDKFEVIAATLHHDVDKGTQTYGSALLSDGRGMGASLSFSFDSFYQCRYELIGQKGKIISERAFTPHAEFKPNIVVETASGVTNIQTESDNHFVKALIAFHSAIDNNTKKEKLYWEILLQSSSLAKIKKMGMGNGVHSKLGFDT